MARESIMARRVHPQKNFKGLPMFLHLKFFKTALMGDIRQGGVVNNIVVVVSVVVSVVANLKSRTNSWSR
jgi:hypothetical protein